MDKRIIWVWIFTIMLFVTGILWAQGGPETAGQSKSKPEIAKITGYTDNSMGDFLKDPFAMYNQTDWVANIEGLTLTPPAEWTTDTFGSADTTAEATVVNARVVRFVFRDSVISGTDSLAILLKVPGPTTDYLYPAFVLREMDQATTTTFIASSLLIPGDNSWQGYEYEAATPYKDNATITGTFLIYRKNINDGATPYLPKTRWAWMWE